MAKKVHIDEVAKAVNESLDQYRDATLDVIEKGVDKASKEAVEELHAESPKRTGAYSRGWTVKKEKSGRNWKYKKIVYNEKHYRLTHLLEKGHRKVNGGFVRAYPHIGKVEQKAVEALESYIRENV